MANFHRPTQLTLDRGPYRHWRIRTFSYLRSAGVIRAGDTTKWPYHPPTDTEDIEIDPVFNRKAAQQVVAREQNTTMVCILGLAIHPDLIHIIHDSRIQGAYDDGVG